MNTEERRKYLSIAGRLAKPGSGSHPKSIRERSAEYGTADVAKFLGDVRFVIVGGLATRLYMPERMTLDIDVLISPGDLARTEQALAKMQCEKVGDLTIGGSTWKLPTGRTLDLIALNEPWVDDAIKSVVTGHDGQPYASLPYLVLTKLAAGRMQDLADLGRMLGAADDAVLDEVRRLVARCRPQDEEDLDSIITLGRLEYEEGGAGES